MLFIFLFNFNLFYILVHFSCLFHRASLAANANSKALKSVYKSRCSILLHLSG